MGARVSKFRVGAHRDGRGKSLAHFDFEAIRQAAENRPIIKLELEEATSNPARDLRTLWIGIVGFVIYSGTMAIVHLAIILSLGWSYFTPGHLHWAIGGSIVALFIARAVNVPVARSLRNAIADRRAALIAPIAVRSGLCGACGYSLDALDPEPDGCTVCPECGAAWKRRLHNITP